MVLAVNSKAVHKNEKSSEKTDAVAPHIATEASAGRQPNILNGVISLGVLR